MRKHCSLKATFATPCHFCYPIFSPLLLVARMANPMEPSAGLRTVSDMAVAAGGHWTDGTLALPTSMGTGCIRHLAPEPGLMLAIHRYALAQPVTLTRVASATHPETLLLSFQAFGTAFGVYPHLSTAQLASTSVGFTTTLPAHTDVFIVALAIEKTLLARWLTGSEGLPPVLFTARHPVVLDTLLTPELQTVLLQVTAPQRAHALDAFFYKIKCQELVYWLFRELATRAYTPARPLHPADVEKIFEVRTALLATLSLPPSLPQLARTVGLSETKMRQLFRQVFDSSLYDYYQAARMAEARRRLQTGSVSEVGDQLGFTNLSHFARLFAKHHGLTPKKYQATYGQ